MENKKSNIKERVLQVAKYYGVSYENFSAEIGMTYSSFKGPQKNTPINSNALDILLSLFPNVSAEWLLTGKGEMLVSKEPIPDPNRPKITPDIASNVTATYGAGPQVAVSDKRDEDFIEIIKDMQKIIAAQQNTISEMSSTINILAKRGDADTVTGAVSRAASE